MATMQDIKKLREETGAGILDVRAALEDASDDFDKALEILKAKGMAKADKKGDRETKDGLIYSYIHGTGKAGSMVYVACETDFVAKTDDFKDLCHNIALQVVSGDYENVEELLASEFIKDPSKTIQDLVKETIGKIGENMEVMDFSKMMVA